MPVDESVTFNGYALKDPKGKFEPWSYHPRPLGDEDVEVAITHCGICASDLHTCFGGWGECHYPIIVGHEIIGAVKAVGKNVTNVKVGDRVGCGAHCGACYNAKKDCQPCEAGFEQYCENGVVGTYNSKYEDGEFAQGGYADGKRFSAKHAFLIPENISSAEAAPLLCAGATVFTPLSIYKAGPGKKVGVIGIGGLGHLAVQFAAKMGAETIAFGTSPSKKDLAINKLGASHFVNIKNADEMSQWKGKLDIVVCTANATGQQWNDYIELGDFDAEFVILSVPEEPVELSSWRMCMSQVKVSGSAIGSPQEIRDMLEFCSKHDVRPMVEVLPMRDVNEGIRKVQENDVKFRVVLEN